MTARTASVPLTAPSRVYAALAATFGLVTLLAFGVPRYLRETTGTRLGNVPAAVLGAVVVAVILSSLAASFRGADVMTAIVLAMGPVVGLLVYLVGYHLVLPPSTDSPTWLIFLAFAGFFVAVGVGAHLAGRLGRLVTTDGLDSTG